jgi:hypothetical protein
VEVPETCEKARARRTVSARFVLSKKGTKRKLRELPRGADAGQEEISRPLRRRPCRRLRQGTYAIASRSRIASSGTIPP